MLAGAFLFVAALAYSLWRGERGTREVILLLIVLAPMRGGLLEGGQYLPLGDTDIAVNAIAPALIAGVALAALVQGRLTPRRLPPLLVYAWIAFAVVCALDFLTQAVGLKLYGIGLAQYMTYPTFALVAWSVFREGDAELSELVLVAVGIILSITVFIQAIGITDFVQAASAFVQDLGANRYAGITGSYLHTSVFLGVITTLALGICLRGGRNWLIASLVAMATVLSAQILTFSRSGLFIAAVGGFLLLVYAARAEGRLRLVSVAVPAVAVALLAGSLGGVQPREATTRAASGLNTTGGDQGNVKRLDSMRNAVTRYGDASLPKQLLGEGLAATGNARKLISDKPLAVESYYLKVLLETGAVGAIVIFPFLIWATVIFLLMAVRGPDRIRHVVGATGFAFSLDLIIYPTLEVQALAVLWWLLLVECLWLRSREESAPVPESPAVA